MRQFILFLATSLACLGANISVTYDTVTKQTSPDGLKFTDSTLSGSTKYDGSDKSYVTISGDYGLGLDYQLDGTPTFKVSARSVQTISQLTNSVDPFSVNLFATVSIQRYSDDDVLSQGGGTFFRGSSSTYPVTPGYVFPSTNPAWNWVRTGTDYVTPAMFGAFGAPNEEQNLVTGNDYNFSSDAVDPAWSGFGDAQYNPQGNSGTNYTYGIYTVAASPSAYTNRATIGGYARNLGLASVPPGGAMKFVITQRGHGYTSGSTVTLSMTGDGGGVTNAFLPIATNSFADGYIIDGKLRLIAQGSTASQEIIMGYDAPNEVQIGGLIRPLQIGSTYRATLKAFRVSGTALEWFAGTSTNAAARMLFTPSDSAEATYTGTFVADGQIVRIGLYDTASTGQVFTLDDIVISEVSPEGSTFQPPDEGAQIAEMILASPGKDILFGPNRRYYSTQGFRLNAGQRVDLQRSWIEIDVGTSPDDGFILFNNGPELHDGRITYTGTAPVSANGESTQNIISLGHFQYWNYPLVENAKVYNLQIEGGGAGNFPMGIVVGGSRNCSINNIYFPDNATLYQAMGVYWTGEQTQSVGTDHPIGIDINNIRGGRFTGANPASGAKFMALASIASVSAKNIYCEYVTNSFIVITPGDIGWQLTKPGFASIKQTGVTIENANCNNVGRVGFRTQTLYNYTADNFPVIQTNAAVTFDTETEEVILASHGFSDGSIVVFSGSAAPSGITFGTRYYVTWTTRDRFMLRAEADGYGNGSVIDIGAGATSVTVTGWRGQQFQGAPVVIRNSYANSTNINYSVAGIYFDGASDITYENVTVEGFRYGALVDTTVANQNILIKRSQFLNSQINGAKIGAGRNLIFEDCTFSGSGIASPGTAGVSEGVMIDNGKDIKIIRGVFGNLVGETTQGAGIAVDNGNYPLQGVILQDNVFRSGVPVYAIRLDDPASATWNANTFTRVAGNTWTVGSGITRLVSSTTATLPLVKQDGAMISYNSLGHLAIGQTDPTATLELVVGGTNFFSNPFPRLSAAQATAATTATGGMWYETDANRIRYYNGTNAYTVATTVPYATATYDLGTDAVRWNNIYSINTYASGDYYITTGSIRGSNARIDWSGSETLAFRDASAGVLSRIYLGNGTATNAAISFNADESEILFTDGTGAPNGINAGTVRAYTGTFTNALTLNGVAVETLDTAHPTTTALTYSGTNVTLTASSRQTYSRTLTLTNNCLLTITTTDGANGTITLKPDSSTSYTVYLDSGIRMQGVAASGSFVVTNSATETVVIAWQAGLRGASAFTAATKGYFP